MAPDHCEVITRGLRLAGMPFVVSRVALGAVALVAGRLLPYGPGPDLGRGGWLQGYLGWDAVHYLAIARSGYPVPPGAVNNGFFPLLPLLLRAAGASDLAAVGLGLVLGLLGVGAVALLSAAVWDDAAGARVAWMACFWPAGFYWTAVYSEGLFVLLLVGAVWAAWRERLVLAAAFGLLCGLARPTGVLVAVPLLLLLPRWRTRWAALAPVAGFLLFAGYLWVHTGSPVALVRGSTDHGNLSPGQPWRALDTAFLWARYGDWQQVAELPVVAVVLVLVLLVAREPRWRAGAVAVSAVLVFPPLLAGTVSSFARYAMVAFPAYWPLRRVPLWAVLAVEVPVCVVWTAFAATGHLTP